MVLGLGDGAGGGEGGGVGGGGWVGIVAAVWMHIYWEERDLKKHTSCVEKLPEQNSAGSETVPKKKNATCTSTAK